MVSSINTTEKAGRRTFYIFLVFWFLINLVQASFTTLSHDESYYWMYSEFPDWGYFDHPPFIAFLIKAGYTIIPNELGVRLLIVIISTVMVYFTGRSISDNLRLSPLFYTLCFGIFMFNFTGFLAVPDIPLLLFTAIFFFLYKKLIKSNYRVSYALLLGISIALMLYSKYHGVLIIAFTTLSNITLLARRSFYIAAITAIILYLPHIYWQIDHDLLSLKFHLTERSTEAYEVGFTLNYLLGQILLAGPLMGVLLLYHAIKRKPASAFERALKYNLTGFLIFFLLSSFKDSVQGNWTAPAYIPLIILSYQALRERANARKLVYYLGLTGIFFILLIRIYMMWDFLPKNLSVQTQFHGWQKWADTISAKAQEKPVVFYNSYQKASKYNFYSDKTATTLNSVAYKRTQYELWDLDNEFLGKDVLVIPNFWPQDADTIFVNEDWYFPAFEVKNYYPYEKINIRLLQDPEQMRSGRTYHLKIMVENNYDRTFDFQHSDHPSYLHYILYKDEPVIKSSEPISLPEKKLQPGESFIMEIPVEIPEKQQPNALRFSVSQPGLPQIMSSDLIRLHVDE